jgi:hypothetical protein
MKTITSVVQKDTKENKLKLLEMLCIYNYKFMQAVLWLVQKNKIYCRKLINLRRLLNTLIELILKQ